MGLSLDGFRIVCLAEQYPGPYATLLLADLGADVILVERPGSGDPARQFPGFHAALSRNKRSVVIDLKAEDGKRQLRDLIASADVLMEGFRPGTMERLGFGYAAVELLNPKLVYVSISGFGQSGPYRDRPAHDLSYQAIAGFLFRQAETGALDSHGEIAIGDLSSGMFAAIGTLAALLECTRTGRGKYIDVSMTDGLLSWMSVLVGPVLNGQAVADIGAEPAYGLFRCAGNKILSLSIAHEDWFWKPFCKLLVMDDVADLGRDQRVAQATVEDRWNSGHGQPRVMGHRFRRRRHSMGTGELDRGSRRRSPLSRTRHVSPRRRQRWHHALACRSTADLFRRSSRAAAGRAATGRTYARSAGRTAQGQHTGPGKAAAKLIADTEL